MTTRPIVPPIPVSKVHPSGTGGDSPAMNLPSVLVTKELPFAADAPRASAGEGSPRGAPPGRKGTASDVQSGNLRVLHAPLGRRVTDVPTRRLSIAKQRQKSSQSGRAEQHFRFNLFTAKEAAREKLPEHWRTARPFIKFYDSDACDQFLMTALYFCGVTFLSDKLEAAAVGKGAPAVDELSLIRAKADALRCRRDFASAYANVVLMNTSHTSIYAPGVGGTTESGALSARTYNDVMERSRRRREHQSLQNPPRGSRGLTDKIVRTPPDDERDLFEAIYAILEHFLKIAFDAKYYQRIEKEIGYLLRTDHFSNGYLPGKVMDQLHSSEAQREHTSMRHIYLMRRKKEKFGSAFKAKQNRRVPVTNILGAVRKRSPLISVLFPNAEDLQEMRQLEQKEKEALQKQSRARALGLASTPLAGSEGGPSSSPQQQQQPAAIGSRPASSGDVHDREGGPSSVDGSSESRGEPGSGSNSPPSQQQNTSIMLTAMQYSKKQRWVSELLKTAQPSSSMYLPFQDVLQSSVHWQSSRDHEKAQLVQGTAIPMPPGARLGADGLIYSRRGSVLPSLSTFSRGDLPIQTEQRDDDSASVRSGRSMNSYTARSIQSSDSLSQIEYTM